MADSNKTTSLAPALATGLPSGLPSATKSKPICTYGFTCGIIDAKHRKNYYHSNPLPYCKYSVNCTNDSIKHRTTFYHYHNSPETHVLLMDKLNQKKQQDTSDLGKIKKPKKTLASIIKSSSIPDVLAPQTSFIQFQQNI